MTRHQPIIDYFAANYRLSIDADDVDDMLSVIDNYRHPKRGLVPIAVVEKTVCEYCQIEPSTLQTGIRETELVFPRQLIMYFGYRFSGMSYKSLAKYFCQGHHTSAMHNVRVVKDRFDIGEEKTVVAVKVIEEKLVVYSRVPAKEIK